MDIKSSKIELVKIILNINNDNFIKKVTEFINNEKSDFWNELSSSEQAEIKKELTNWRMVNGLLTKMFLKRFLDGGISI